jgi:DNA-binding SARP family transcriptional activator
VLLAVLLLRRGEVVSRDRLIDELWGERAPANAVKTVQTYVSNLRKALGNGLLLTRGHGYVLQVEPDQLDADRVEALVREGRDALETGGSAARERATTRGAGAVTRSSLSGRLPNYAASLKES